MRAIDGSARFSSRTTLTSWTTAGAIVCIAFARRRNGCTLIDALLMLSRVTREEMRRDVIDLSALARSVATELQRIHPERKVEFNIAPGIIGVGDGSLVRVALENLIGNAWKFTSRQPKAQIEFGAVDQQGSPVYFVRDNGAGFDMVYADKLFGAFQRLHTTDEIPRHRHRPADGAADRPSAWRRRVGGCRGR